MINDVFCVDIDTQESADEGDDVQIIDGDDDKPQSIIVLSSDSGADSGADSGSDRPWSKSL